MMPLSVFSQRIFIIASISTISIVLAGLLFYQVQAQPLARVLGYEASSVDPSDTASLSGSGMATSTAIKSPTLEVHIANNGLMLLRGARVLSVSGNTIRVGMTWDSSDFNWMIQTSDATKFLNASGGKETVANIHTGDIVTVTGKVTRGGAEPVVTADFVRK